MEKYDVIVIGGGASGMMTAGRASELGKKVLLLEKNKRMGEKIRIGGGGRSNVTNGEKDIRKFLSIYGKAKNSFILYLHNLMRKILLIFLKNMVCH